MLFQERIYPYHDGSSQGLTQKIHAQGKVLQGEEQENAHPGGGGIAADPDENQGGQYKMEYKQEYAIVSANQENSQIQEEIARFRPVRATQAGS